MVPKNKAHKVTQYMGFGFDNNHSESFIVSLK